MFKTPDQCQDMTDVREAIDAIDRDMVACLRRRQDYLDAAARIKTDRKTVRDPARVAAVIAKVRAEAARIGLSEESAETVWNAVIDAAVAYEHHRFDELRRD